MNRYTAKSSTAAGVLALSVLMACWPVAPVCGQAPQKPVFQAGAATSNITPPLGLEIVGGWTPIPSTHVHDELHARCLVLDNGDVRLALVICDNLGIPRDVIDEAKRRIHELDISLPADRVLVAATHTHSSASAYGPNRMKPNETFNDYQKLLISRIVDAVRTAVHNLVPAQIGWGLANEPSQVFNRRWLMKPGDHLLNPFDGHDRARMNPPRQSPDLIEPAGPTDPQVPFISVRTKDGRPIALLANYALHYVGGVERGALSADYFAVFAECIRQRLMADRLDPPFVGIMSNGSSGDINNIDFRAAGEPMARYQKMRLVADQLAKDVYEAHANVQFHDWIPLAAVRRELVLKVRKPSDAQAAWARQVLARTEKPNGFHELRQGIYARRFQALAEAPDDVAIVLQALRVGDVGIAAVPFEVFVEIGLELKQKGPLPRTFVVSFGNGSYGYLPTVRHHALGGYETWMGTNNVEVEAAPKIVKTVLGMFDEMR